MGSPLPAIQSAIAVATFASSVTVVAEGTLSGARALETAVMSVVSAHDGCSLATVDTDQCVFLISINQTVDGRVYLRGFFEDYNRPVVEHCHTNPLALDYTGKPAFV